MLNLYLLRHAKSSRGGVFTADFERPLSAHGRRDAQALARHMAARRLRPDLILCSPSKRTRETLAPLAAGIAKDARALFEDSLYGGAAAAYLALIQQRGEGAGAVLLIGHNPAIAALALLLIGGGDNEARAAMAAKFPTCALAHITFELADWSSVATGAGDLSAFIRPRDLER